MKDHSRESMLNSEYIQSENSPRTHSQGLRIENHEILGRAVIAPEHVEPNGELREEFIPIQDLLDLSRGLSVTSEQYGDPLAIGKIIAEKKEHKTLFGVANIRADVVRNIRNPQELVIVEDSLSDNAGHALIFCAEKYPKSHARDLRKLLFDAIQVKNSEK